MLGGFRFHRSRAPGSRTRCETATTVPRRTSKKESQMATTLNPSEISELIRERIEQFKLSAETRNEGTLTSVSDGIVRIHGLNDVMAGEMIELPGDTYALALNLERDSVGAVVLGKYEHLSEGN